MTSMVTLQDVADAARVHRSTVSLALRESTRISLPLRRRIQKLAQEMGYRVNPLVAALMQSRRSGKMVKSVSIAYVTCYPTRWGWKPPHVDRPDYFPGAVARATELGYKLEHFWLAEPGMSVERFCGILTTRAINGVIVGRLPPGKHSINLLWERFSCVAVGRTLHAPILHRITEDHFASSYLAMTRLIALGYRRIGFVFSEANDSPGVGDRWLGGYFRQQMQLTSDDRLPPFMYEGSDDPARTFAVWYGQWRPDVLLVTQAEPLLGWLKMMGKKVPDDVEFATLVNDHLGRGWAGIHSSPELMGSLSTEMVVGMMHRSELGIPSVPHEVLLPGEWILGSTLRRGGV